MFSRRTSPSCDTLSFRPISHGTVNEYSPFIFIGGMPRSGTTLMRAMLDAHPDVRCGEETRVIPRILGLNSQWRKSAKEWNRLQEAGVTDEVLKSAVASFIIQVIAGHGAPAPRLCNKDPLTMKSAVFLSDMLPNARYIFMIRDGRATVHSIISRKVTITGFDLSDYRQCMTKWNSIMEVMDEQCTTVGDKCLKVYYEQLVLHPEPQMRRILKFLKLRWNESVLHHEEYIGKDVKLSKVERSSDQDVLEEVDQLAPMLRKLGYDTSRNPPNYGKPDELVSKKTEDLHRNREEWYKKAVEVVNDPERVEKPLPYPN
uniref:Protein-tyrosine sulfotransferase n=1 Tax=Angiostrongylus cantonensis TaxID=6313 RepID=A0A158P621_ANGCA